MRSNTQFLLLAFCLMSVFLLVRESVAIVPELNQVSTISTSILSGTVWSTSWQLIDETYYLAVGGGFAAGNNEDLRLYKFDDTYDTPQLIEVSKVPTSTLAGIVRSVDWQLINGTYYLAVGGILSLSGGDEDLRLYKFDDTYDTPQLIEVSKVPTSILNGNVFSVAWQLINGTYYLAVGGSFFGGGGEEDLRLYRLDDTYATPQLIEVSKVPISTLSGPAFMITWQLINGTYYLAVGGAFDDEDLRLYKFDDDTYAIPQLIEVSKVPLSTLSGQINALNWQFINGIHYLSVGGILNDVGGEDLRLYKFDDTYATPQLIEVSTVPISTLSGIAIVSSWQLVNGAYYLAIGGNLSDGASEDLRLYKFDDSSTPQFIEVSRVSFATLNGILSSISWQLINGTYYLSVGGSLDGSASEDLRLYKLSDCYGNSIMPLPEDSSFVYDVPTIISNFIAPGAFFNFEIVADISSGIINIS